MLSHIKALTELHYFPGLYAKLSMTELRAHTGICSGMSPWL